MKHNVGEYTKCANCGACLNACPVNAISVNAKDFFYQIEVDDDKCINCGLCIKVCPVHSELPEMHITNAYGGYHKDKQVVRKSSSGGAFYAIAQGVLDQGGIVFGAAYSEDYHSVVFRNTDEVSIESLLRSKYVESSVGVAFRQIKEELKKGRKVLFCGTPCQVAGLKRYIGSAPNLYTCDFSCGGLPSHRIFDDYLKVQEKLFGANVAEVNFRPKLYGWKTYGITMLFKNGKKYRSLAEVDPYFSSFLHHRTINRDYCYECDFADHHSADIILADFWLHDKVSDLDNRDEGLSLLLVNSEKGNELIERISDHFYLKEVDVDKASYNIKSGHVQNEVTEKHKRFMKYVAKEGFIKTYRKYCKMDWRHRMKLHVKAILKMRRI